MALASNEAWRSGFVVVLDGSGNPIQYATTYDKTGAHWQGGFLRDPDGRLVVTSD